MKAAVREAFARCQKELVQFSEAEKVNMEASGASGTVCIQVGTKLLFAWIGDSRVMLGSYARNAELMLFESFDHKPELPEEKTRIEKTDPPGEVRECAPGAFRIYIPGQAFPGLTMSRCFGDLSCANRGISQEPSFHEAEMRGDCQWYLVVASDGVWEFLDAAWVTKKLRLKGPKETGRLLIDCSRKRWEAYEGTYCDDITAIVVQFNVRAKGDDTDAGVNMEFTGR